MPSRANTGSTPARGSKENELRVHENSVPPNRVAKIPSLSHAFGRPRRGGNKDGLGVEPGGPIGEDYFDALGFDYDFDYSTPEFVDEEDILGRDTLIPLGALDNDEQPVVGIGGDDEEIVEEWRPMSPGGGGFADDNDRYDF